MIEVLLVQSKREVAGHSALQDGVLYIRLVYSLLARRLSHEVHNQFLRYGFINIHSVREYIRKS